MLEQKKTINAIELRRITQILSKSVKLNLDLNELRIIVGCFRLAAYMAEVENEPYLDAGGLELRERLERLYKEMLDDAEPKAGDN
jgi:hypothetical protein